MSISPKDTVTVIAAEAAIQDGRGVDSRPRIGYGAGFSGVAIDLLRPFLTCGGAAAR